MTETVVSQRNTVSAEGFANPLTLAANAEASSHVKVYGDDVLLQIGVDYTLDGVGDTGNLDEIEGVEVYIEDEVLLATAYSTFTVEHDPPLDQETSLSGGGTLGRIYEAGLDALARRFQALGSKVARTLRLAQDAQDTSVELPLPEHRRGLVWVLDQDTGDYSLQNTAEDPDTEPLTAAVTAQAAAEAAQAAAEAAQAVAEAQALEAADSADRAEEAAAGAGDLSALLNYLWPVGATLLHNASTAPANFLKENGAAISRTTYSALFAVVGTTYGAGDGSTTFNVPESRGEFFRGLDDGRGVDSGRALGSAQAEMIGPHSHTASIATGGAHSHTYTAQARRGANGDYTTVFRPSNGDSTSPSSTPILTTTTEGAHSHTITIDNNAGTENRPRNVAKLVCIKF